MAVYTSFFYFFLFSFCRCQNASLFDSSGSGDDNSSSSIMPPSSSLYSSIKPSPSLLSTSLSISISTVSFYTPPVLVTSASSLSVLNTSPTPTSIVTLNSINLVEEFSGVAMCTCDLTVQSCDTNCCCDDDCNSNIVSSFSTCTNEGSDSLSRQCLPASVLFRTSLLSTSDSDLFCIYSDNYPGRLMFSSSEYVNTINEFNTQLLLYGRTGDQPSVISTTAATNNDNDQYKSGDVLRIRYTAGSTGLTGYLSLPSSFNGAICHDDNPITYLNDQRSTCSRILSQDGSECVSESSLNPLKYYENISISVRPGSNDLLPLYNTNISCINTAGTLVACDNDITPRYNGTHCNNVLKGLEYIIFHNGTQGVLNTIVIVTVQVEVPVGSIVNQEYSVRFISNGTVVPSLIVKRSGAPGYVAGSPVLAGELNTATNEVTVSADNNNWLTLLRGGGARGGDCGNQRSSVSFRDNMKTSCVLRISRNVINGGCTGINSQTLNLLKGGAVGGGVSVDRIGVYGNSNPSNLSQWVPLIGEGDAPSSSGCSSIITGIHYTILYGYNGRIDTPDAVITGAKVEYVTTDIAQLCPSLHCSSSVLLSLYSSVSFVPVYDTPAVVLKTGSISDQSLPGDFLYPLLSANGVGGVRGGAILTVTLSLIIFKVFCN